MTESRLRPVEIYEPVRKLIRSWSPDLRRELGAVLVRLQRGEIVGMPDVRPMPTVARGAFEVRISSARAAYRAFYITADKHGILVFHAFEKKSQKTPQKEIATGITRLTVFLKQLET